MERGNGDDVTRDAGPAVTAVAEVAYLLVGELNQPFACAQVPGSERGSSLCVLCVCALCVCVVCVRGVYARLCVLCVCVCFVCACLLYTSPSPRDRG